MKMLNIGCGHRYHPEWTNIDVDPASAEVMKVDIIKGLPFEDNSFDLVYHSNVLEHLPAEMGKNLIRECYRVLKPGGLLRINVPDLEKIAREYLYNMEQAKKGDAMAPHNYDWILIEMLDQVSRNQSGGQMGSYLSQPELPNPEYLRQRLGDYANNWRKKMSQPVKKQSIAEKIRIVIKRPALLKRLWYGLVLSKKEREYLKIGRFRLGGEVHYHMYDSYSLGKLLESTGFKNIDKSDPVNSRLAGWNRFNLDSPDDGAALIMEATK